MFVFASGASGSLVNTALLLRVGGSVRERLLFFAMSGHPTHSLISHAHLRSCALQVLEDQGVLDHSKEFVGQVKEAFPCLTTRGHPEMHRKRDSVEILPARWIPLVSGRLVAHERLGIFLLPPDGDVAKRGWMIGGMIEALPR